MALEEPARTRVDTSRPQQNQRQAQRSRNPQPQGGSRSDSQQHQQTFPGRGPLFHPGTGEQRVQGGGMSLYAVNLTHWSGHQVLKKPGTRTDQHDFALELKAQASRV